MLNGLPFSSLCLWTSAIVLQVILSALFSRKDLDRYPAMRAYIFINLITGLASLLAAWKLRPLAYFYVYYASLPAVAAATGGVVFEIYRFVFGPRVGLPLRVPERAFARVALALAASVASGILMHSINGGRLTRVLVSIEQVTTAAAWAVVLILAVYSRKLGIRWPIHIARVATGFILYTTISIFAVFVRARAGAAIALIAGQIGQAAFVLAAIYWLVAFWKKEPEPVPATDEQINEMLAWHRETMDSLNRGAGAQVFAQRR